MRGENTKQSSMLMLMSPETRVPATHPLRSIKKLADAGLAKLSPVFDQMYSTNGRPSIPPERLLKSMLLIALYTVRSERQFCEQLNYNLLACPPTLAELPGYPDRKVPMLLFQQNHHRARVYLVRTKALPPDVSHVIGGATYKLEIIRPAEGPYSFLVVHDGDDLDWLSSPEAA